MQSTDKIIALAPRFKNLFAGMESAHGIYNGIEETRENGKLVGKIRKTVREPVTLELWERHLAGESGLGVILIREDSTATFGGIDIDEYSGFDHKALAQRLERLKLPLVVCRSKSGGAHIYLFASEPVEASKMVARLQEIASLLGYGSAEIYPKQTKYVQDDKNFGSWLNMPYSGGMKGLRWAVRTDGDPMAPEEFLFYAEGRRQSPEWFAKPLQDQSELTQGPPCLQHLVQLGFPQGTRNNGLYNLGVYCRKADPEGWEQMVETFNQRYMDPPLDASEVLTVVRSLKKKTYSYQCSQQPIAAHCNSALCRGRKFGVGTGTVAMPEMGRLAKLETEPPLWFLDVEGQQVQLTTKELQDPLGFQAACMEQISLVPPVVKRDVWGAVVAKMMAEHDRLPAPEDSSRSGQLRDLLEKFCNGRAQAMVLDDILLGRPFTEADRVYFILHDLARHLERARFKAMQMNEIVRWLQLNGGEAKDRTLKGLDRTVWSFPAFRRQLETHEVPESIKQDPAVQF